MSVDKNYRVIIRHGDNILATYTLHTEFEAGEYIDVSSTTIVGEPNNDPLEDEAIDVVLKVGTAHGKEDVQGFTVEWFLIN